MKNCDLLLAQGAVIRLMNKEMPTALAEKVITISSAVDRAVKGQDTLMGELGLAKQEPNANGQVFWTCPAEKREEVMAAVEEYKQAEVEFDDAAKIPYEAITAITPADLFALQPLLTAAASQ